MSITFRDDVTVVLRDSMGGDSGICEAARVSTLGVESIDSGESYGLINFLMKNRHGSPFEHGSLKFYMELPIFAVREFHRHRIGFSYNEVSGRYKELEPVFYVPAATRPLRQVGKPGAYTFVHEPGVTDAIYGLGANLSNSYRQAWKTYQTLLAQGIAKELARIVLPVGIYTSQYVTCNPRSLMAFLSLRTKDESSTFPSYPQHEIELVARKMEAIFAELYPQTYKAFNENGRVAP